MSGMGEWEADALPAAPARAAIAAVVASVDLDESMQTAVRAAMRGRLDAMGPLGSAAVSERARGRRAHPIAHPRDAA